MSECDRQLELGAYHDGQLPRERRPAFEAHLADCGACGAELRTLRALSQILSSRRRPVLPQDLRQRLYVAARDAAVPGVIRLVKVLTAAAAAVLIVATVRLMWMQPSPAPARAAVVTAPDAWEQAALVADASVESQNSLAVADRNDLRMASWIATDLSVNRGRNGQN